MDIRTMEKTYHSDMELFWYQEEAVNNMHNGCILCGDTGSGKSITAIAYYFFKNGGHVAEHEYTPMPSETPPDLYIITTAKKRDSLEWEKDLLPFQLSPETNLYKNKVTIDSWNNIKKYADAQDSFFIFDEQRLVGNGVWVKSFLSIAKRNEWILLTATPGDKWEDYIPTFIANGFYKNRTEFIREHIVYKHYGGATGFRKVDRYLNTSRLVRLRSRILVQMNYNRETVQHHDVVYTGYDMAKYRAVMRNRWNPFKNAPLQNASELCYTLRQVVNSDPSRLDQVKSLLDFCGRAIIFYNFDYELELLKNIDYGNDAEVAEWNGHKHQPVPKSRRWVYLVQYTAGSEGWNCTLTDTIIFYSQNYSYKTMVQAAGRIDRLNTPYKHLYYYHLKSKAPIDFAISKAISEKRKFNEKQFIKW